MRILYLSYYYFPHVGGGAQTTYNLSSILAKKGHKIILVTPNIRHKLSVHRRSSEDTDTMNLIELHRTPIIPVPREVGPFFVPMFVFLAGIRVGKGVNVIISQHHPHHPLTPVAVTLGRILRAPVILRADDIYREMGTKRSLFGLFAKMMNSFNERFIKYSDGFFVVCSEWREILQARIGKDISSCTVGLSPNGVDLSELNVMAYNKDVTRRLLGIGSQQKVLLFVGRFSGQEYGISVLLEALQIILKTEPNAFLYLVGDVLTRQQEQLVDLLGIRENVRVFGPMDHKEVMKLIVSADICIGPLMPTMTIPLKVLEYMACGKPVVTGRYSVSKDLAKDYVNCLLVDLVPADIARAVLAILTNNDLSVSLGNNASRSAEMFRWERIVDDLIQALYKRERKGKKPP